MSAASIATKLEINDFTDFVPTNEVGSASPVIDRYTDLSEASLAVKKELLPFKNRVDLMETQTRFASFLGNKFS